MNPLLVQRLGIEFKSCPPPDCGCGDHSDLLATVARTRRLLAEQAPLVAAKVLSPAELSQRVAQFRLQYGDGVKTISVHPDLQARAEHLACWAAAQCGIVPPAVHFCDPEDMPPSLRGPDYQVLGLKLRRQHAIYLSTAVGWDRMALLRLVCHETAHAARDARPDLPHSEELVMEDERQLVALALQGG